MECPPSWTNRRGRFASEITNRKALTLGHNRRAVDNRDRSASIWLFGADARLTSMMNLGTGSDSSPSDLSATIRSVLIFPLRILALDRVRRNWNGGADYINSRVPVTAVWGLQDWHGGAFSLTMTRRSDSAIKSSVTLMPWPSSRGAWAPAA